MPTLVYDTNDPADWTYDNNKVEIVGGQIRLKLQQSSQVFTENFTDDTGFTYDNTKLEFVGGAIQSKSQLPTNAVCAATYTTNENLSLATFTPVTGTLNGSPTFTSNVMTCSGSQGVNYDNADIGNVGADGAIKFKFTPNFTGNGPASTNLVWLQDTSGNNNKLGLTTASNNGTIRLWLNDSSGASKYLATAMGTAPNFTAGVELEIELNWSTTTGDISLFIDGNLHATLNPGAWTRGTSATKLHVGATTAAYNRAEGDFSDVILYDTVQHTSSYTPGYTVAEEKYLESSAILPTMDHTGVGTILTFDGLPVTSEVGAIRYTIKVNGGVEKYWDGASWSNSNGTYSQASTSSDMDTNLPSLTDANGATSVYIKMILPGGETSSSLDNLVLSHTGNTGYVNTDELVVGSASARTAGVSSISSTQTIPSGDSTGWLVYVDGIANYWNGSAWTTSNETIIQTNTLADMQANIGALNLDRQEFKLGFFLVSGDQTTTPYVDSLSFSYTTTLDDPATQTLVFLEGFIYDHDSPVTTTEIQVRPYLSGYASKGVFHKYKYEVLDTTNSDGYFNAYIYANKSGEQWEFKIGSQSYRATIPDVTSVDWSQLTITKVE